jgi:probable selenium-dependent hydroxylase accessory protein YqeC
MGLLQTFGVADRRAVHLIGAGGKTTLMYALASEHAAAGRTVVTATSTKIREPKPGQTGEVILAGASPDLPAAVAAALARHRHVTVGNVRLPEEGKLAGLSVESLEALIRSRVAGVVLVEADGARHKSLKAHAAHEPVIAPSADGVIAVIGADVLGKPASDEFVHRAELFRERLGLSADHAITAADIAGIVFREGGWLARVPVGAEVIVFVRGASEGAHAIALAVQSADTRRRLARVVVGEGPGGALEVLSAGSGRP